MKVPPYKAAVCTVAGVGDPGSAMLETGQAVTYRRYLLGTNLEAAYLAAQAQCASPTPRSAGNGELGTSGTSCSWSSVAFSTDSELTSDGL